MRELVLVFFLFAGIHPTLSSAQESRISRFDDFQTAVNRMEEKQEYVKAIQLIQSVWHRFPDRQFELIKEIEYLNEKTGQAEKNLDLWEKGHQLRYFFLLNRRMPGMNLILASPASIPWFTQMLP